MKFPRVSVLFVAFLSGQTLSVVHAQEVHKEKIESADAVRSALAKKEGEGENKKLLEDTLTSKDRQYSLLKAGKYAMALDATYAYSGSKQINGNLGNSSVSVSNLKSHSLTTTFALDYGLRDDLTLNASVPLVGRYSQSDTANGKVSDFGDISIGARFQPLPLNRDLPTLTLSSSLRLPTGGSPFKSFDGQGLSSGAGYSSITGGLNISKILDPAALFGSVAVTYSTKASNLNQSRNGARLVEVDPGVSFSFGAGFATALSYRVSTSLAFQQAISTRSKLTYVKDDNTKTVVSNVGATSAMLNFGLGVRYSPVTTLNVTLGVGLTSDSPDFTFGVNLPLAF